MQCGNDGLCDDVPGDDAACGAIECPDDTDCRDYENDITSNRCAAFGQCRTTADCDYEDEPARTKCGDDSSSEICDGDGNCEFAEVYCQPDDCRADPGSCCRTPSGGFSCLTGTQTCPITGPGASERYECNDVSDCSLGQICCRNVPVTTGPSLIFAECTTPVGCATQSGIGRAQICSTNEECLSGTCQRVQNAPYPYSTCR